MRKFTYIDTRSWKVVGVNGKTEVFVVRDKSGDFKAVSSFNGFRSASAAARKVGGTPVRE